MPNYPHVPTATPTPTPMPTPEPPASLVTFGDYMRACLDGFKDQDKEDTVTVETIRAEYERIADVFDAAQT